MMLSTHRQAGVPHAASLHALSKPGPLNLNFALKKNLHGEGLQ